MQFSTDDQGTRSSSNSREGLQQVEVEENNAATKVIADLQQKLEADVAVNNLWDYEEILDILGK